MNNHIHRSLGAWLRLVVFSVLAIAPFSMAQASSVAIDTLSVNSASFKLVTNYGTYNFSGPVSPPVDVIMGTYQNPIVGGTKWKIYSTGPNPAPTGTVDGALGKINVDFSSLRGQATLPIYGSIDFALWPLINPPSPTSTYNGTTGIFSLKWSDPFKVSVSVKGKPITISGIATVTLGGTVTPVPLPAAVLLLGSGLLGLAGAARRKKA